MPRTNSTKHLYRFIYLLVLVLDVPTIVAVTLLLVRGIISAREGAIGMVLLFVVNFLLVWMLLGYPQTKSSDLSERGSSDSLPKGWFPAVVFTVAGIAPVVAYIREPNTAHGVQVGVAVLLVAYCWYIVYSLYRMRKDQIPK
jgi:uncharacterized membrane protein